MKAVWCYAKAQAGWSWALPPLVLAVMLLYLFLTHRDAVHAVMDLYGLFEFGLPLAAAFYLAGLPVLDREEGTAEVHLSYPQAPSLRLLLAAVPRLLVWGAALGGLLVIVSGWYLAGQTWRLVTVAAAPALALTGAAVGVTACTRHELGGLLTACLWWMLDLVVAPGKLHSYLNLFRVSRPLPAISEAVQTRNLVLLGGALWLLALGLAHRRERWIR